MSKNTSDKDMITGMFSAEASEWLDPSRQEENQEWLSFEKPKEIPVLPQAEPAPESELRAYWRTLRAFFRSGKGGGIPDGEETVPTYPALLSPYRTRNYMQPGYPCWIRETATDEPSFFTLSEFLEDQVQRLAPEGEAGRILRDNMKRLEHIIGRKLHYADGAFQAKPVFEEALEELNVQLSLPDEEAKKFSAVLTRLWRRLPEKGVLLAFSSNAPIYMLGILIRRHLKQARQTVRQDIARLINQLSDILTVEREKSPDAQSPEHLHSALDFADSYLNFEELSSVLPSGSSEAIPEERHQRIEKVLETLQQADSLLFEHEAFVTCAKDWQANREIDWSRHFPAFAVQEVVCGRLSETLADTFDDVMKKATRVFAALRLGKIEAANEYNSEVHADFFAHFDWRNLEDRELAACAPVLLIAGSQGLLEKELNEFSRLLASNRPVKLLVEKSGNSEVSSGSFAFRQELGALAVAHRNPFVCQSAIVNPRYLHEGFGRGLLAPAPALFHLLRSPMGSEAGRVPDLWLSAAVEGREFPSFIFDSQQGPRWGNRFEIQFNPGFDTDWPLHELPVRKEKEGEETPLPLPFTFADFAAQDPRFGKYFQVVPPRFWTGDLTPLADYLKRSSEEVLGKVPYVWLIRGDDQLQRAVVTWPLVLICQERLDFWHYLQENAGVHSYHVERATDALRRKMESTMAEKISALKTEFEKELEAAREESARAAMERLASVLLDLDADTILPDSIASAPAGGPEPQFEELPEAKEEPSAEELPPEEEEEESMPLGEAWVETPLCTSCNECIDTNSKIFQYNADKQAFVADPMGGPFADIVKAAVKCPVKIIHPGAPQNPDEPNLEEWVERAAAFQK